VTRPPPDEHREQRRAEIVRTALGLLEEGGLERLSLRRVAHVLGMHPPGLYWYIQSKQELIDLMSQAILREVPQTAPPAAAAGRTWEVWLTEVAKGIRRALLAHRDGARVVAGATPFGNEDMIRGLEQSLGILEGEGFTRDAAMLGLVTVIRYTIGIALDEQASPHFARARTPERDVEVVLLGGPTIDAERFPRVADVIGRWLRGMVVRTSDPGEARFAQGLGLIIAGIRVAPGSPSCSSS
jgi:TetR/AcrR family tetracycline transcriptional repressor